MENIGQIGEKFAANYLVSQGYSIVKMNHFNQRGYRIGEIDLIAKDPKGWYVFVEVKSRKGNFQEVAPEENITISKIRKIIKVANEFLRANKEFEVPWRIDAILLVFNFSTRKAKLRHIKHIHI